jgi:hypothetical protein
MPVTNEHSDFYPAHFRKKLKIVIEVAAFRGQTAFCRIEEEFP